MAQQNGTVDVQRKNTGCTVIYIYIYIYKIKNKKDKVANQNGTVDE